MKNIEDGEPLNIFPLIDKSLASITIDKKSFKDLGLGSVAQSVLISDCVINNAKYTSDSFLIDLKDNSMFTFKDNGMITLGNSLEGETPKIKNSTFGDSFGDM